MIEAAPTPLQMFVRDVLAQLPETRDWYDSRYRERTRTSSKPLWDIDRGKSKKPSRPTLKVLAELLNQPIELFERAIDGERVLPIGITKSTLPAPQELDVDMVGIHHADLELGMGAVFIDNHVEAEVLKFPRKWVETITYSPAELLTWARGRGDSMFPTISDGDLVLIDRSQTTVREQDSIWAFTVGDVGSIKRLRVKGDRYIILSDNPSVSNDEEPQDFVRIVGRVVFVGAKK